MTASYCPRLSVLNLMARGEILADRGRLESAINCFGRAIALDPDCVPARLYQASLRLLNYDESGALSDFRALESVDYSHLPAYRDLQTLSIDDFPEFLPLLNSFLSGHPDCPWGYVLKALSLRQMMRYVESIAAMDRAVLCRPKSAALLAIRSRVKLVSDGRSYDGVCDIQKALSLESSWGWLWCWQGEAMRHQGLHLQALSALDRGLAMDSRYRLGFSWRGAVYFTLGQYNAALRDLNYFLRWDPIFHSSYDSEHTASQKAWAYNQRMAVKRGLRLMKEALLDLNQAHALENRYHWVHNPSRDPKIFFESIRELSLVINQNPRSVWARAWRGWCLAQWGDFEKALDDLDRSVVLSPSSAWPWAWRGRTLFQLGRITEAKKSLRRSAALNASYAPVWAWLGDIHIREERWEQAAGDFSRAIRLDYRGAWAYAGRGKSYNGMGRNKDALDDLNRAIAIYPRYRDAYIWRAKILKDMGMMKESLSDLRAARGVS